MKNTPLKAPPYTRGQALPGILASRIAILDGAMGTMIQRFKLGEEQYRGAGASHLELEILETSALQDVNQVSQLLSACTELGVSCSLDDFGTAHSGTRWLERLSVDLVKIDMSIVSTIGTDSVTRPVLDAIIALLTSPA